MLLDMSSSLELNSLLTVQAQYNRDNYLHYTYQVLLLIYKHQFH